MRRLTPTFSSLFTMFMYSMMYLHTMYPVVIRVFCFVCAFAGRRVTWVFVAGVLEILGLGRHLVRVGYPCFGNTFHKNK